MGRPTGRSHLYDFDRRWLLGRIDARLLVGLQFDLLSHQEEADLRRQYLPPAVS